MTADGGSTAVVEDAAGSSAALQVSPQPGPPAEPGRLRALWLRHRTLFWALHSVWALLTGVAVVLLARERYGFVPWVGLFLVATWLSTVLFGRRAAKEAAGAVPGAREEVASYVTRTLYQETLFFLLPFYAYSTVVASPNVVFTALLVALALLSCLDVVFDRLLRTRPAFGMLFFSTVAFAALTLLIPMLWPLDPSDTTVLAALIAVGSGVPLALRGGGTRSRILGGAVGVVFLSVAVLAPVLVPPVPLRLDETVFASGLNRETLEPIGVLAEVAPASDTGGDLYAVVEVFAPSAIPATVSLEWRRDGELIRTSRDIGITAHAYSFRVWDAWSSERDRLPAGRYEVVVRTSDGRVFGRAELTII